MNKNNNQHNSIKASDGSYSTQTQMHEIPRTAGRGKLEYFSYLTSNVLLQIATACFPRAWFKY